MQIKKPLAAALLVTSTQAFAADGYAGLGFGVTKADFGTEEAAALNDGSFTRVSADNSDTALQVFAGVDLTPNFGIEAAYTDLGEISVEATSDGSGTFFPAGMIKGIGELTALSLSLKLQLQQALNDTVSLQGKLGVARWDADAKYQFNGATFGTESKSGTDPLISIGVSLKLSPAASVGLQATRYMDVWDYDTDLFGATVSYRFP